MAVTVMLGKRSQLPLSFVWRVRVGSQLFSRAARPIRNPLRRYGRAVGDA